MDILHTNFSEEELIVKGSEIAEYLSFCQNEQCQILDGSHYEQYKGEFHIDNDRDFVGAIADESFHEQYGFLYGKTYGQILEINNINQAIHEVSLDDNIQKIYGFLHGKSYDEIMQIDDINQVIRNVNSLR